jgi:HSP20 family protein
MARKKEKVPIQSKDRQREGLVDRTKFTPWVEMDRLFNQFRSSFNDLFYRSSPRSPMVNWNEQFRPPVADVIDHGDTIEMNVELPGISKDDINVEVTPYNIEISARTSTKEEEKGKTWIKKERNFNYYRNFDLPDEIKSDDVDARMKDGILTITMPKEEPTPTIERKEVKIK